MLVAEEHAQVEQLLVEVQTHKVRADAAHREVDLLKRTHEIGGSGAMLQELRIEWDEARRERDRLADAARGMIAAWELWDRDQMDETIDQLRAAIAPTPKGDDAP